LREGEGKFLLRRRGENQSFGEIMGNGRVGKLKQNPIADEIKQIHVPLFVNH